jgi:hypothetical protein
MVTGQGREPGRADWDDRASASSPTSPLHQPWNVPIS